MNRRMMEAMFINNPALIMSGIRKWPELKTTALGGVATGSINAHDAAIVAGIMSKYG